MNKINLRIITVTLSGLMLLSSTSCKLQKNNKFIKTKDGILINLDEEKFSNIKDEHLKEIIVDLIQKVEDNGYNLSIQNFIEKLSKTIFIKNPDGEFKLGTYNAKENILTYLPDDDETIRHELLHMLLPSYNNSSLDEGIVQIFLNELYGYKITGNVFDASLCKIFFRILDKDELSKFLAGDIDVLKNKLASIKPAYKDAEDFLIYANNGEYYYRLYNESAFNNKEQEFKEKDEYKWLKSYRKAVKDRIKIYLYSYYDNMDFTNETYDKLVEIFEMLNLINYIMYNPSLEEEMEQDYFLRPIVDKICTMYDIDGHTLKSAEDKAKEFLSFKYLDKLGDNEEKNITVQK